MVSDDPTEAHMRHGSPVVTPGPERFGTARDSVRPWQESLLAKVEWCRVEPVVEMSKIMITLFCFLKVFCTGLGFGVSPRCILGSTLGLFLIVFGVLHTRRKASGLAEGRLTR